MKKGNCIPFLLKVDKPAMVYQPVIMC